MTAVLTRSTDHSDDRPGRQIPEPTIRFDLDPALEATQPPEARGVRRDHVRLMVSPGDAEPVHTRFDHLVDHLDAGDLLVVNTSATIPAALDGVLPSGEAVAVHFSTELPGASGSSRFAARPPPPPGRWCSTSRRRSPWHPVGPFDCLLRTRAPAGCGLRPSMSANRSSTTSCITAARSATATSPATGRSRTTGASSPRISAAPRCRARPARSPPRSSPTSSATASCSPRSSSTPASRRPSSANLRIRSATPSAVPPPHW